MGDEEVWRSGMHLDLWEWVEHASFLSSGASTVSEPPDHPC